MSEIRVDTISEKTSANGVSIDSVTLKDGAIGIGTTSPSTDLHIKSTADNAPHLLLENFQNADTDDAPVIELYLNDQTTGGIGDNTDVGVIRFTGDEKDGGTKETYAEIRGVAHDPGQGTGNKGHLSFFVQSAGSLAETMTLDESRVGIGTDGPTQNLEINVDSSSAIPTNEAIGSSNAGVAMGLGIHNESNSATYTGIALETRTSGASRWLIANEWQSTYNGDLVFRNRNGASSSTEVMRLTSGGIAIGGTGAANTLDDYEEGTWTPTFTSGGNTLSFSGGSQTYEYTKVGNVCTVTFNIANCTTSGTAATGDNRITLPFTATGGARQPTSIISYFSSGGLRYTGADVLMGEVGSSSAFIQLQEWINSTGYRNISSAPTTGGGTYFWFSLTYLTA